MGSFDEYPPAIRAILERVAEAGYREVLVDEAAGNRFVFTTMAASTDPTVREIGEQLRDGALDLDQLARSDFYRETLDAGLDNLSRLDPDQMTADLESHHNESRDEHERHDDR
jgi:hypothetical protein